MSRRLNFRDFIRRNDLSGEEGSATTSTSATRSRPRSRPTMEAEEDEPEDEEDEPEDEDDGRGGRQRDADGGRSEAAVAARRRAARADQAAPTARRRRRRGRSARAQGSRRPSTTARRWLRPLARPGGEHRPGLLRALEGPPQARGHGRARADHHPPRRLTLPGRSGGPRDAWRWRAWRARVRCAHAGPLPGAGARPGSRRRRPLPGICRHPREVLRRGPRAPAGRSGRPRRQQPPHRRAANGGGLVGEEELGQLVAVPLGASPQRRAAHRARAPQRPDQPAPRVPRLHASACPPGAQHRDRRGLAEGGRRQLVAHRHAQQLAIPGRQRPEAPARVHLVGSAGDIDVAIRLSAGQWFSGITRSTKSSGP